MISMIAAMDRNRVIGQDNRMPWHIPADLAYFKKITLDHPVIMGRKTFESIGKPLPGRENVILTKKKDYQINGCLILHSTSDVLTYSKDKDVFVIGGAQIYQTLFPYTNRLYITFIAAEFLGDSFFPEINPQQWELIAKTPGERNERNPYEYYFLVYAKL